MNSLSRGLTSWLKAAHLLFAPGFKRFLALSALLGIALFATLVYLAWQWSDDITYSLVNAAREVASWLGIRQSAHWLSSDTTTSGWARLPAFIALLFLFNKLNKYLLLALLSPVLSLCGEKAEQRITGVSLPFKFTDFISDIGRALVLNLRNLLLETGLTFIVIMASVLLPISLPFTAPALFVVSAYFYGFAVSDYVLERRRASLRDTYRFMSQNRMLLLGLGMPFAVGMAIPFIGVLIVPVWAAYAAVYALTGYSLPVSSEKQKQEPLTASKAR